LIALICNAHHAWSPAPIPRQRRSAVQTYALCCAHWLRKTGPFTRAEHRSAQPA